MSDITYRLVKGTELTFGELDRNFGSLDSDMVALSNRFDSFASERGLDSARTIALMREHSLDSDRTSAMIDSAIDSAIGTFNYDTPNHDSDTLVQVDSAYVRFRADSDYVKTVVDSNYIKFIADSDYIRTAADSDYIRTAADSDYIRTAADSDYIRTAADSAYVSRIAEELSGLDSQNVWDLLDGESRHLLPQSTETYDLGSNLRRWRDLYVRDAYISTTTIYLGTADSPQRSSISVDSAGNFELASPTSTGLIATSSTGTALDSNVILSLVDSAYVQSRQTAGGGGLDSSSTIALIDSAYIQARQVDIDTVRDSAFIFGLIDSAYIQLRQVDTDTDTVRDSAWVYTVVDSAYVQARQIVGGSPWDSAKTTSIIDSAYIQARQVDVDTVRDSAFITGLVDERIDSTQFLATTATTTDVSEGDNLYYTTARHDSDTVAQVDSAYVQQRVRGPEMIAGGRIKTSASGIWIQNGTYQKQLFGIWDSGQGPGGTDGIDRLNPGLYKFQFDSANLARITSGDDYTVMAVHDYGRDDPSASSRTVSVYAQEDSSFQILLERSDTGDNENYSDEAHINFQVWLY